ncbi:MAG: radical SAM protein [Polyangia bacterium]|jgi:radical SAM superfamily enzyme YgiQ (UPF0313 family)|nr:radical SAM protein [Polyangia bacterium]
MNTLLVHPRLPLTYWGFQHSLDLIGKRASLPPLGLLSLAALLPRHWQVRLVDLNVTPLSDDDLRWADLVLTGGLLIQAESLHSIIARSRAFELPVAVGGPAPTTSPELFTDADIVFRGEAEGRIDELVEALARAPRSQQILDAPADYPEMETVPPPRFDLLDLKQYASMSLQYSRGCPFRCEFCDIVAIFGHRPRVKTPEQVLTELESLYLLGYRGTLFFVDDNFIGNRREVKRLLPRLREWQRAHGHPFELYTEASVDLAADPMLLADMAEAGFTSVFVGIETPSHKALEQAKKLQNLRLDLSEAVDRITRAGLEVMGGFIVGFDSDDEGVFAEQRQFLARQPIPLAMVGLLTALPGTELWTRLEKEHRLRARSSGETFARPNFAPAMDERALITGYAKLLGWLYSADAYYARCHAYLHSAGRRPAARASTSGEWGALLCAIWRVGVLSQRRLLFWRLMGAALLHGRDRLRQAVVHAVQGEHLIRYTREQVLPRLEAALSEILAESLSPSTAYQAPAISEPFTPTAPLGWRGVTGRPHENEGSRDDATR